LGEKLDGDDDTSQQHIFGLINSTHSAFAYQLKELIAIGE
jgi:hypothetical protein